MTDLDIEANVLNIVTCYFLWANLSWTQYGPLDHPDSTDYIYDKLGVWNHESETLASWLVENEALPLDLSHHVNYEKQFDRFVQDILYKELSKKAEAATNAYPELTRNEWLYHYLIAYLEHSLIEADRMMHISPLRDTKFQVEYLKVRGMFDKVIQILRQQQPASLKLAEDITTAKALHRDLFVTAQELASKWRFQIILIVTEILSRL